jgi:hypothetical protein
MTNPKIGQFVYFREVNAKLRLELHLFQQIECMSTYVYIFSLEVRG